MRRTTLFVTIALIGTILGGCIDSPAEDEEGAPDPVPAVDGQGRTINRFQAGEATLRVDAAAGALSRVAVTAGNASVVLPETFWLYEEDRLTPVPGALELDAGANATFLVTPFTESFLVEVTPEGGTAMQYEVLAPYNESAAFVSGSLVYDLMQYQNDHFPHRTPSMPNYVKAQEYFVGLFQEWGYEIVVQDEYGTNDLPQPDGLPLGAKPQSLANVYAYRPGTGTPDRIVAFGGHYDAVEQTVHSAFDDTSGTMMTLALAKAFSQVDTDVGLLFGLWGGEEDGLLGSQFFVRSKPDLVSQVVLYVNLDVSGMSWPGPHGNPVPLVISSGPDGPVAAALETQARHLHERYFPELPEDMQVYEDVGQGQATGSGVNAQSDHTPFMSAGVPVYFPFTGDVDMALFMIHRPADTLYNMTYYMGTGERWDRDADANPPMDAEEFARGRELNIRSFESFMMLPFYSTLELDSGLWTTPREAPGA